MPDNQDPLLGAWGDLDKAAPEGTGPSAFSVSLAAATGVVGASECALTGGPNVLPLLLVVLAGTIGSFLLRSAPMAFARLSALPAGVALLLPLVVAAGGAVDIALGGAAGLLTLLAVGAPDSVPRPLRSSDLGRAAALPSAATLVVGIVYEVPLGALNQPAAFIVVALVMLGLLAVYLSSLAPRPNANAG
jgi:hypothetical protein